MFYKNHNTMKIDLIVLFLTINFTIFSCQNSSETQSNQDHENSELPEDLSVLFADYIPENFAILKSATGDLNQDGILDVALVLHQLGEDTIVPVGRDYVPRPLLLFLKNENGEYSLVTQNDKAVYCYDCGGIFGDPFYEVTIENGVFTIYHYGGSNWRWTRDLTFKYDKNEQDWFLHREELTSFSVFELDDADTTLNTPKEFGRIRLEEFDAYLDY